LVGLDGHLTQRRPSLVDGSARIGVGNRDKRVERGVNPYAGGLRDARRQLRPFAGHLPEVGVEIGLMDGEGVAALLANMDGSTVAPCLHGLRRWDAALVGVDRMGDGRGAGRARTYETLTRRASTANSCW
jgi:hypothetical protein